jgi:hypothetical protein
MDSAADQETGGIASDIGLADLSGESLVDILSVTDEDSALGLALSRAMDKAENGMGIVSAFGSFIS